MMMSVRLSLLLAALLMTTPGLAQRPTRSSAQPGAVSKVKWSADGKHVYFTTEGKRYRFDLTSKTREEFKGKEEGDAGSSSTGVARRRRFGLGLGAGNTGKQLGRPTRGRQHTSVESTDGKWVAKYEDWNVVVHAKEGDEKVTVTTEGNKDIHYGTASWVYGEELNQTTAIWWTPDSKKLLYYRFDDTNVKPFYLIDDWTKVSTELYPEYYPKAGATNPSAELWIYDFATKKKTKVKTGGSGDEYIYNIRATPGDDEVTLNWTNRLQQHMKVQAINVDTGDLRTIVEEKQDTFQKNSPPMRFLKDHQRFIWPSDKTGYTHYELRHLDGRLLNTLTKGAFQTGAITFVDEESGWMGITAYSSSANPYYMQYHLAKLDGSEFRRITSTDLHHTNFNMSPDKQWLIAQCEDVNVPPTTAIYSTADGSLVAKIAESDQSKPANLAEWFSFKSNDGKFDVYAILYKPKDFDATKQYPMINALYGGPGTTEFRQTYVSRERSECRDGYLVAKVNNRGTGRRGKAFETATYLKLGDADIQDHADAMKLLGQRPYVDARRIGIVGHSYGGYMAALGACKFPDVYAASVARAAVTHWQNYDTIYTERYMSTPQLNPDGYENGSVMKYAKNLKAAMVIMHGMRDDNVHPNNAFQLIQELDKHGIKYESRFWPLAGHGLGRGVSDTQKEFFKRILKPGT